MENVQLKLKETRNKLGLTQVEIAKKLGMAQATYQKIESGKNSDIRISTLVHICKTLDVSADWLLGLKVNSQPRPYELIIPEGEEVNEEDVLAAHKLIKQLRERLEGK